MRLPSTSACLLLLTRGLRRATPPAVPRERPSIMVADDAYMMRSDFLLQFAKSTPSQKRPALSPLNGAYKRGAG